MDAEEHEHEVEEAGRLRIKPCPVIYLHIERVVMNSRY